jgi:hypothetical protein
MSLLYNLGFQKINGTLFLPIIDMRKQRRGEARRGEEIWVRAFLGEQIICDLGVDAVSSTPRCICCSWEAGQCSRFP